MPTVTHGYRRARYTSDEVEMILEEVCPGEEPMDMTLSDRDSLTGDDCEAMIVPIRTRFGELEAAQDLVDMPLLLR